MPSQNALWNPPARCAWVGGLFSLLLFSPLSAETQDYGWINNMGGSWSSSGNWSPTGGPPFGPGNTASITLFGTYTVTVDGSIELDSLTYTDPFGTLTGGNLVLDKGFNWSTGTLGGPLRVECDGDSEFTGDSAHTAKELTGSFVNGGTVNWLGSGSIEFANGGTITNNALFNCAGTGYMVNSAGNNLFFNSSSGTLASESGSANVFTIPVLNEGAIQVQGGSLTFDNSTTSDGPVTVDSSGALILSAAPAVLLKGPVKGPGFVTVTIGQVDVFGGFTAGINMVSGNLNFNGLAAANLAGCNLTNGSIGGSNLVMVSGPFTWQGGSIAVSSNVVANGGLKLAGPNLYLLGATLVNTADAVWTNGGSLGFGNGASFSNAPGATFTCNGNGTFVNSSVPPSHFDNGGTFLQLGGSLDSTVAFNNSGNLDLEGGALALNGGGTNSGSVTVQSNATFTVSGGSEWFVPGSSIQGGGLVSVLSGTLNLAGDLVSNAVAIAGGTLNCFGTGTVKPSALSLLSGTLGGSNLITLDGALSLTAGTMSDLGGLAVKGLLSITNNNLGLNFVSNTLVNLSQALLAGTGSGGINFGGGSVFSNAPGAVVDFLSDLRIVDNGGANLFINAGLMRKLGGTIGSAIAVPFVNSGTTEVDTATLAINTATNIGLINVFSNATLALEGGTQWFNPGSSLQGDGLVSVLGGTCNLAGNLLSNVVTISGGVLNCLGTGNIRPSGLNLLRGALSGSNAVTVAGGMAWLGGAISAGGLFAEGDLAVTNQNSNLSLSGSSLTSYAHTLFDGVGSAALIFVNGSVFTNRPGAVFDFLSDVGMADAGGANLLVNAGLMRKLGGTIGSAIAVPIVNSGTTEVDTATLGINTATNIGLINVLSNATLALQGGTQWFNPGSSLQGDGLVSVLAGTCNLAGNLLSNIVTVSGGVLNCLGTGDIRPSGLNLLRGTLSGSNAVTITGDMAWLGGALSGAGGLFVKGNLGVTNQNANLSLSASSLTSYAHTLFDGVGSAALIFVNGSVFTNRPGAVFDFLSDVGMADAGGANLFVNAGLMRKLGGTIGSAIAVPFVNSGTAEVDTATLGINTATNVGLINVLSNATLALQGGTQWFNPGSSLQGDGLVSVLAGTCNLAGNLLSNIVTISGGVLNCLGTGDIRPSGLNLLRGTLSGSNAVTITGDMAWLGGALSGAGGLFVKGNLGVTNQNANLSFSGSALTSYAHTLFDGVGSAALIFANGSVFTNAPGAIFDFMSDVGIADTGGTNLFANTGLMRKLGGLAGTALAVPFFNSGTTEIWQATLALNNAVTCTGTIIVSNLATLALTGGNQLYDFGSLITGGGNVTVGPGTVNLFGEFTNNTLAIVNGGGVNFNGTNPIAPTALSLTNGFIAGSNLVSVSGPMQWFGATIGGTNEIRANGGLNIGAGTGGLNLVGRTLVNQAAGQWGNLTTINLTGGAVLSNAASGTFDCTFDGTILNNGLGTSLIANAGRFRKTGGTNATVIAVPFDNSGTVEVQTGTLSFVGQPYIQNTGTTALTGGNIVNSLPLQILGGTITGSGSISGSVTNSGVAEPGAAAGGGQLTVGGGFTQTPGGALDLRISGPAPGSGFATLQVGTAVLDGALNVTLENGYAPPTNALFTFLRCGNRSGTFSSFNYPSNQYAMSLVYTPTNVAVQIVKASSPKLLTLSLSFGGLSSGPTTISFYGLPGSQYSVQYATSILGPWQDFATNSAAADGSLSVLDTAAATITRFYRVRGL